MNSAAAIAAPTSPASAAAASSTTTATTPTSRRSRMIARKRLPSPASGSSSCTPSGVAIVRESSYSMPAMMERFQSERGADWAELDAALRAAGDKPERLGASGVRRLGALYRAAAADLAYARRAFPGDPAVAHLEALVLRARAVV